MAVDFTVRIGGTTRLYPERLEALEDLIDELRTEHLDGEVAYRPPTGRGVTLWEVTGIYLAGKALDAATGAVADRLLEALVERVKSWTRRQERPQVVTLYGRNGEPLMVIRRKGDEVTVEKPDEGSESG